MKVNKAYATDKHEYRFKVSKNKTEVNQQARGGTTVPMSR